MLITISKVLGIDEASIELSAGAIVEVVGPNEAGKTSCATAAQALFAQDPNPLALPAAEARRAYLHDGDTEARASMQEADWEVVWRPAAAEIEAPTSNGLPISVPEAVGIVDFCARRNDRERAALLHATLLPDPEAVLSKLESALQERLPPEDLAGVLDTVREGGWKKAEGIYTDRMRRAKRYWKNVTGTDYGVRKAEDWRPDAWQAAYDNMTITEAEADVVTARDALSALHRADAITEHDLAQAQEAADKLPEHQERLADAESQHLKLTKAKQEAAVVLEQVEKHHRLLQEKVPDLLTDADMEAYTCPECNTPLILTDNGLEKWDQEAWDEQARKVGDQREAALVKLAEHVPKVEQAKAEHTALALEHGTATEAVYALRAEVDRLKKQAALLKKDYTFETEDSKQALAYAEQAVEDKKEVVDILRSQADAAGYHANAVRYGEIAKVLGPAGVRAQMLEKGLATLNAGLGVLSDTTGWPVTAVDARGAISYGGRPAPLCSESARWRIQAMLQLTLAAMTDSGAVVLDRADLLDSDNRAGLEKALLRVCEKRPIAVLLCSTGTVDPSGAPWPQVWIEKGRTQ